MAIFNTEIEEACQILSLGMAENKRSAFKAPWCLRKSCNAPESRTDSRGHWLSQAMDQYTKLHESTWGWGCQGEVLSSVKYAAMLYTEVHRTSLTKDELMFLF